MVLELSKHYCENMSQAEKRLSKLSWNTNEAANTKKKQQCKLKSLPTEQEFKNVKLLKQSHRPYGSLLYVLTIILIILCNSFEINCQKTVLDTYYYVGCFTARTDLLKESVYAKTPLTCIEICQRQNYS